MILGGGAENCATRSAGEDVPGGAAGVDLVWPDGDDSPEADAQRAYEAHLAVGRETDEW